MRAFLLARPTLSRLKLVVVCSLAALLVGVQVTGAEPPAYRFPTGPATPPLETATPPDSLSAAEFADPPMWARPQAYLLTSPDTTLERTKTFLQQFKDAGLGGITYEAGGVADSVDIAGPNVPGPGWPYKYLSEEWFVFWGQVLDELERLGMTAYQLDVPFTMSGSAQGQVAQPDRCGDGPEPDCGDPSLGWTTLQEIVPQTLWQPNTRPYWLDPLNPDAVDRTIRLNYGKHYDHLSEHFGKTLQAMWSDEVSFQPTGTPDSFRGGAGGGIAQAIPWTGDFAQHFKEQKGYELTPQVLDRIFHPNPSVPDARKWSYDYWDVVSRRFADTYYGGISRWSAEHGLGFIGQLLSEEVTTGMMAAEGSYFRSSAQATIDSLDLITNNLDLAGGPNCDGDGCYGISQKMRSSSAHLFGRKRVHMEAFDIDNAEIKERPQMLRARIDHGISRGVNHFAWHSYNDDGSGWGPRNVLFPRQKYWNDYTARLQYMFTPGVTLPDIAVGYAPENFWVGDSQNPNAYGLVAGALRSAHYEHDFFPIELMADPATSVEGGVIRYGTQSYRAIVVPDWSAVHIDVAKRLREFVALGGTVVSVGRIPKWEVQGNDADLAPVMTDIFGFNTATPPATLRVNSYGEGKGIWAPGNFNGLITNVTPQQLAALDPMVAALQTAEPPRVDIAGDPKLPSGISAVQVLPYERAGSDVYFVSNFPRWENKEPGHLGYSVDFPGQPASITVDVPATGVPELWNAETGEITRIWEYKVVGNRLHIPVELAAFASAVIRLAPGDPSESPHITDTNLDDAVIKGGQVRGFAPAGLSGPAYAVVRVGSEDFRVEIESQPGISQPLDPVYTVTYTDGGRDMRRAGSWNETQLGPPFAGPRFPFFRGTGTYAANVSLPDPPPGGRVVLDLGRAGDVAEVTVNDQLSGFRAWPPYEYDITNAVGNGADRLEVAVTVSEAAALGGDPRYPAGLLGPVAAIAQPLLVMDYIKSDLSADINAPSTVVAGESMTLQSSVQNIGKLASEDVKLTYPLPAGISFDAATVLDGTGTCIEAAEMVDCNVGRVGPGEKVDVRLSLDVLPSVSNGSDIRTSLLASSPTPDDDSSNNTASDSTDVDTLADVSMKLTSAENTYKPSGVITYRMEVSNSGPSNSRSVVAVLDLPGSSTGSYSSGSAGCSSSATASATQVTCQIGTLGAGAKRTLEVKYQVKGNKGTIHAASLVTSKTADPNPANNTSNAGVSAR
ncbi:MAG TPA: glycosyl hydrolase [Actinomycetota bacterium]|nr:glycosyl hydrolase [Actinomycetota bacterium]